MSREGTLLKVLCPVHSDVIGRVWRTDGGPVFETYVPLLPGKMFVGPRSLTRGLGRKEGRHIREAGGVHRIQLSSPEAERWTFGPEHHGTLPSWCRRCSQKYWVVLGVLRTRRGTIRA